MNRAWRIRLARQAESDLRVVLRWTARYFGAAQAELYAETVMAAIEALRDGPRLVGARARDEIAANLGTLHVARQGRKGRPILVFRVADEQTIEVLRLLHDSMDLVRHVPISHPQKR